MSHRILVIDDDPLVRRSICIMLEETPHEVFAAADGVEGLRLFQAHAPDLVITDLIMPEKEGIETILDIRKLDASVKILAISGGGRNGNKEFLTVAQKLGADEILAKPFEQAALLDLVEKCFAGGGILPDRNSP